MTTIVWFRHDLRLADQPALQAAIQQGGPVIPVYFYAPAEAAPWSPGGASRWWLHHSLQSLDQELRSIGSRLIVRNVDASQGQSTLGHLQQLIRETGATNVCWNRCYEPQTITRDTQIKAELRSAGINAASYNGSLLFEPTQLATQQGNPFQVFSPFWRACLKQPAPAAVLPRPSQLAAPAHWPASDELANLNLLPRIKWDQGMRQFWSPGAAGAEQRLQTFLKQTLAGYKTDRDFPSQVGSSLLSPHLHFGEISPRQIWHAVQSHFANAGDPKAISKHVEHYLSEIGWREFAYHLLYHFPQTHQEPLRPKYAQFPWRTDKKVAGELRAWQRGLTGYPIVDAGMRQLWHTGWMHNRVRMIVASFLVKDLLISWQQGAAWFWDTLVDADLASNTLGWQWTAGCGADAAPYFRIFNPISQGEKFDANGAYVRQWVPELTGLSDDVIHAPWTASTEQLHQAKLKLGHDYPLPIVDHAEARTNALAALATLKEV